VQRNGLDAGEKKGPEFTDKPSSPGGWSTWQTAQRKIPEFLLSGKSLPSLHFKKIQNFKKFPKHIHPNAKIKYKIPVTCSVKLLLHFKT